jgi:hypothetical protein
MTGKLDEISKAIGGLEQAVIGLRRDLQQSEKNSVDHRTNLHRRVDDLVSDVGDLGAKVASMEATVTDSKSVTDDVKRWKLMGMGALAVVGLGGTALGVMVANSLEAIARFFRH